MINEQGILRGLQEVLNRGYGDQATSPLDRTVAQQILNYLREIGWTTPEEVAIIVQAVGGKIVIPDAMLLADAPDTLSYYRDPLDDSLIITTNVVKVVPGEIVDDRPKVEHRTVESGPIQVRRV